MDLILFATGTKVYMLKLLNKYLNVRKYIYLLQRILVCVPKHHRLNLADFIDEIADLNYVIIKLDVPLTSKRFPGIYPAGKDLDIIVSKPDYDKLVFKTGILSIPGIKYDKRVLTEKEGCRVRFEIDNSLHYQIDVRTSLIDSDKTFVQHLLKHRVKEKNYYIPSTSDEIIVRIIEFLNNKSKKHHLCYIRKNFSHVNWSIIKEEKLADNLLAIKEYL